MISHGSSLPRVSCDKRYMRGKCRLGAASLVLSIKLKRPSGASTDEEEGGADTVRASQELIPLGGA